MTVLMDRQSPGAHAQLSRLERGKLPYPTFNFIMDYLRACGAGVEDLLDLLKPYTSQPPGLRQKGDARVAELLIRDSHLFLAGTSGSSDRARLQFSAELPAGDGEEAGTAERTTSHRPAAQLCTLLSRLALTKERPPVHAAG